jgi:cytidine deaminase
MILQERSVRFMAGNCIVFYEPNKYSIHAEVACIRKCKDKKILMESELLIIKIKEGKVTLATPCAKCQKVINKSKIRKLVCSSFDPCV